MSHCGVEVAPLMPTVAAPPNHAASSSARFSIKCVRGFSARQISYSTLPLEESLPATNSMTSFARANSRSFLVAPGDLAADRVLRVELDRRSPQSVPTTNSGDPRLQDGRNGVKRRLVHRGLGEKHRLAGSVHLRRFVDRADHEGVAVRLSNKPDDFRVVLLPEDHDLVSLVVELPDPLLHFGHHRTGRIDERDPEIPGEPRRSKAARRARGSAPSFRAAAGSPPARRSPVPSPAAARSPRGLWMIGPSE